MMPYFVRKVVLFPGEGSRTSEKRAQVARRCPDLLERCSVLLREDPFLRIDGSTRFQQPAIICASWAGWTALDATPDAAAEHSLGELTALAAAGVFAVEDVLELVVLRGRLRALADRRGSMVALVGASEEDAVAIAEAAGVTIANDNAPGHVVLAGPRELLKHVEPAAMQRGVRVIPLPLAGAFHTPSMAAAVAPFRAALSEVALGEPRFPVYSRAAARPFEDIPAELAAVLLHPVHWRETFAALHEAGGRTFVETGPGNVLTKLAKCTPRARRSQPSRMCSPMSSATLPPALEAVVHEARRNSFAPAPPRTASILGLGRHLPAEVVLNDVIAERIGVDDAWIFKRTGIRSRRRAAPDERLSDLATLAGRKALDDAGVDAIDLDLLLVATMSQDEIAPNTAPIVAHALGAERAGAIDIGAACTAWISGLALGAAYVETGRAERVLLIGADTITRLTDFDDRATAALFGDGAGAVVLGAGGDGAIGPIMLRADGGMAGTIVVTHEERKVRMIGHDTFCNAVKHLSESTVSAVARAGLQLDDVDLFVYHQANGRIIRAVGERLNLPSFKVADYVAELGNTSAASIPLTLDLLREDGRLRRGQRVLVAAIGAGFNWGAGVLEWGIS